jgi:hypothetical protein
MTHGPQQAPAGGPPPHAAQVVRRVLLRRNVVIDIETAQLVAAAVHTVLQACLPAPPPRRRPRLRATNCEPLF